MKLAFTLFHYFPYGGLERDMLAVANACLERGHQVTIYTRCWQGGKPAGIRVVEMPGRGWSNHRRAWHFVRQFLALPERNHFDAVIGFNRMPGLDIYYAADVCFAQRVMEDRSWWYRLGARCRSYLALEAAVFAPSATTRVLALTKEQIAAYRHYYQTGEDRFSLLTPGILRDRVMPANYGQLRQQFRADYQLADDAILLLMVGSNFRLKGVGQVIRSLQLLPPALQQRVVLWVAGQDRAEPFLRLARRSGLAGKVRFLGPREDVARLMWSADMFLHPSRSESAGMVLLEAMVAGLPVVTTFACGYAAYVESWQMGEVLDARDAALPEHLAEAIPRLLARGTDHWRRQGQEFAANADIFSRTEQMVKLIEEQAALLKEQGRS